MRRTGLTIGLALLATVAFVGFNSNLAEASPQNSSSTTTVPHSGRVVLDLVEPSGVVIVYDTSSKGAASSKGQFPNALFADSPTDHRFVLFESQTAMQNMSPTLRQDMISELNSGKWIVGLVGDDFELKEDLDMLPTALQALAPDPNSVPPEAMYLYRNPAGILNELILPPPDTTNIDAHAPTDPASLGNEFTELNDWYRTQETVTAAAGDPWHAIQNYQWDAPTYGSFRGSSESVGSHRFTLSPYWLSSDQNGKDWYRVDFQTYSFITNYKMTGNKFGNTSGDCGWWSNDLHAYVDVTTAGGSWWAFMPNTTVGSTNTSFTIGGNITTSQAGVSGAYSKSYGTSDVTITVHGSSLDHTVRWTSQLRGCDDYGWYPAYTGASGAAKSSYNLDPSLIIDVPAGKAMQFKTYNGSNNWDLRVQKDRLACGFACLSLNVTRHYSTYYKPRTMSCTKTACTVY